MGKVYVGGGSLDDAAAVWAAAAGAAGAYAPRHIAEALRETEGDMAEAVSLDIWRADQQAAAGDFDDYISPRGCDVEYGVIRSHRSDAVVGPVAIHWRTSVICSLYHRHGDTWTVRIPEHPERLPAALAEAAKRGFELSCDSGPGPAPLQVTQGSRRR